TAVRVPQRAVRIDFIGCTSFVSEVHPPLRTEHPQGSSIAPFGKQHGPVGGEERVPRLNPGPLRRGGGAGGGGGGRGGDRPRQSPCRAPPGGGALGPSGAFRLLTGVAKAWRGLADGGRLAWPVVAGFSSSQVKGVAGA